MTETSKKKKSVSFETDGAGGRTRTGTPSLAVDFESTTSANSITPARTRSKAVFVYDYIAESPSLSSKKLIAQIQDLIAQTQDHSARQMRATASWVCSAVLKAVRRK